MSKKTDALGDRMKRYEGVPRHFLTRRVPVIIRVDGKAFHTITRGMEKPFDRFLMKAMQETMKFLCENIQGCVFGYNVQKMTSIAASYATFAFNRALKDATETYRRRINECFTCTDEQSTRVAAYERALAKGGFFDARVFTVPKDEVCNCLIWRQQDATRNSIEAVGQAYFSANELHKKSTNMIQEMLWSQHKINWNDFPTRCKRGSCCYRVMTEEVITLPGKEPVTAMRNRWQIDNEIPIFTQDREFVERWL